MCNYTVVNVTTFHRLQLLTDIAGASMPTHEGEDIAPIHGNALFGMYDMVPYACDMLPYMAYMISIAT